MLKQCGGSEHYKMYKKGKTWIFAGILTSFFLVTTVGTETAHAETTDHDTVKNDTQQVVQQPTTQEQQVTLKTTADQKDETVPPVADEPDADVTSDAEKPATDAAEKQTPAEPENTPPVVEETQDNRHIGDPVEKPAPVVTPDVAVTNKNTANPDKTENVKPVTEVTPSKTKVNPRLRSMPAPQPVTTAPVAAAAAVQTDQSIDEWMPNKRLQGMVLWTLNNSKLGKTWADASEITKDDMLLLTTLSTDNGQFSENWTSTYIDGKTSFSLEGLQYATNLTSLDLINNLNLGEGWYNGDITDITPLSALSKLTYLQLSSNRITDISPIAGLKNIIELEIPYNYISDLSSLNAAQYTKRFTFNNQLIINDPVVVDGESRTYTTPIVVKLPQNYQSALTPKIGYGWAYHTTTEIYNFLPAGIDTVVGGNIVYSEIPDQVMPGSTAVRFDGFTTYKLPYSYYLSQSYFEGNNGDGALDFSVYTPYTIAAKAQAVTVHYQDTEGNEIAPAKVLPEGMVGDAYTTEPLVIKDYTLKTTPENAAGTYGDTAIDVTYVYTKNAGTVTPPDVIPPVVTPDQTITVTVHYQTADGTTVAPDVLVTGKGGDTYTTSPAANVLDGYELVTTPANASGTLGDSDFTVTYVYAKSGGAADKVTPDTDKPTTKPTNPTSKPADKKEAAAKKVTNGGQAAQLANSKKSATIAKGGAAAKVDLTAKTGTQADQPAVSKSAAADLPQTNSREQTSPFWGIALLVAVLGVFGFKLKRKE
ncbi:MucBP domain-containing protein [Levilactobacillus mulengensis]|uniref:MucBP domain-containing protein n=1 Tax=Levilactobacillus mulengensis TaxID=2486025 RepID=UPI0013DE6E9E|nr:MucBP domain-containing protein [Levilactobacillus mulengensis]